MINNESVCPNGHNEDFYCEELIVTIILRYFGEAGHNCGKQSIKEGPLLKHKEMPCGRLPPDAAKTPKP